jgi:hypothetical protein
MKLHHAEIISWVAWLGVPVGAALVAFCLPIWQGMRSESPLTVYHRPSNLGNAIYSYLVVNGETFPPAATTSPLDPSRKLHGWQTLLLSHMEAAPLARSIDLTRPWDDSVNASHFREQVTSFQSPQVEVVEDDAGWSLTHYSANSRVFRVDAPPLRISDFTDGVSTTLLIGEIAENYPPWGRPGNVRDPALGLYTSNSGQHCSPTEMERSAL